jgi:hypothetical protein
MEIVAQQRERAIAVARAKDRDTLARQKRKLEVSFLMLFVLIDPRKESKRERRRRLYGQGRYSPKKQVLRVQIPLPSQSPWAMFLSNDDGKEEIGVMFLEFRGRHSRNLSKPAKIPGKHSPFKKRMVTHAPVANPALVILLNDSWIVRVRWH